ncbi:MAG: VCBS repeat-containing protein [Alphaproteobacteria bacterium]|nr:VCBS repeat-containing protein [Alphaproteobacteria bacterium]
MRTCLLVALAVGCKGDTGDETPSDDSALSDDTAPDDTGEPAVVAGQDFALYQSGTLAVYLNADRNIPESVSGTQSVGQPGGWTTLADFDGDGRDDLWQIAESSETIFIYMNDGSGTITTPHSFEKSTGLSLTRPWLAGDFTGDGLDDIAQLNTNTSRMVVLPNNVGVFDDDQRVGTDVNFTGTGQLFAADFDGDGTDDIGFRKDGTVSVWPVVDGVVGGAPLFEISDPTTAVAALGLDVDDDGLAELALWSGSTLWLYANTGGAIDVSAETSVLIGAQGDPLAGDLR